jgi:hypothetical protein
LTEPARPVASIDPRALKAFEAEMERRKIELDDFNLNFYEDGLEYWIVLDSKFREPGLRGADPNHPEVEVAVSKVSFEVVKVIDVK